MITTSGTSGWRSRTWSRKPWTAGHEGALAHRVGVHDVDAELEADQVGGLLADHPRRERIELALPGEAEALEVDAGQPRGDHRPHAGRRRRRPRGSARSSCRSAPTAARRWASGGRTAPSARSSIRCTAAAFGSHTSTCFSPGGEAVEADRGRTAAAGCRPRRCTGRSRSACPCGSDSTPASSPSTTRSNAAGGPGSVPSWTSVRCTSISIVVASVTISSRPPDGIALEHRQRDVVVLRPRPGRHAVQHDPAVGGLELDDARRPHRSAEDVDRREAPSPISRARRRPRP